MPGDVVLVNLKAYAEASPQVGDIVVFADSNKDRGRTLIKRIVRIDDSCSEMQLCTPERISALYVEGDNKAHSYDSRSFGAIASSRILRRASAILITITTNGAIQFDRSRFLWW